MTDTYRAAIVIESDARNHTEQFINSITKKADKGKREFGVDIRVSRIDLDKTDIEEIDANH